MKTATKKKLTTIRKARNQTGGAPIDEQLSPLDLKIISLYGIDNLGGDTELGELGFGLVVECEES